MYDPKPVSHTARPINLTDDPYKASGDICPCEALENAETEVQNKLDQEIGIKDVRDDDKHSG